MEREFVRLLEFEKQCKRIGLDEDDIEEIEKAILNNPAIGELIKGTGGIRKFRIVLPGRGKRSGARVFYVDFVSYRTTYLITVLAKSETGNLTKSERNELKGVVNVLKSELRKKGVL